MPEIALLLSLTLNIIQFLQKNLNFFDIFIIKNAKNNKFEIILKNYSNPIFIYYIDFPDYKLLDQMTVEQNDNIADGLIPMPIQRSEINCFIDTEEKILYSGIGWWRNNKIYIKYKLFGILPIRISKNIKIIYDSLKKI
jgi:hypothetical protein